MTAKFFSCIPILNGHSDEGLSVVLVSPANCNVWLFNRLDVVFDTSTSFQNSFYETKSISNSAEALFKILLLCLFRRLRSSSFMVNFFHSSATTSDQTSVLPVVKLCALLVG